MVQPKYSPQEALERVKLMMKYDMSKTLNENKEIIFEQDTLTKTGIATASAAGTAAALGGALGASNITAATTLGAAAHGVGLPLATLGASLGASGAAAAALGAAVVAGGAALALTPLIVWYLDKDNEKSKVHKIIQYCTTDKSKIDKIERGLGDNEIRDLSDKLYDAMKGVGTNEEQVYGVFNSLKSASDFCALVTRFNRDYGSQGDILEWLDDDFDASSEWVQIYRPIRNVVEDALLSIKDEQVEEDCTKNPNQEKCKGKGGGKKTTSSYKTCSSPYKLGCISDSIRKIQGCLGLVSDGKFGPKTQTALKNKFPDKTFYQQFTDSDVEIICKQKEPNKPTPETGKEEEVVTSLDF
jgi:hypothetical protein